MTPHKTQLWAVPCLSGRNLPRRLRPRPWLSGILEQKFASTLNTPTPECRRRGTCPVIAPPHWD